MAKTPEMYKRLVYPVGHGMYPEGAVVIEESEKPTQVMSHDEFRQEKTRMKPAKEKPLKYDSQK